MNNVYVLFINSAFINGIMSVGYQENIKAKKKPEIGLLINSIGMFIQLSPQN